MTFKQRLPFFLVGLTIGIIAVIFFFGKKKTTFDYGPNARVLKNISIKKHIFSEEILQSINSNKIDTSTISLILKEGKADMWNKIKLDTCTEYNIKGTKSLKNIILTVKNCDSTAIIEKVTFE
ncbi:hypothetical protein [Lutibacter sp. B1]|uniref:hypothetical protein n=1 Tax=Lutibacter sp. B1 TaxID=2725996 RepID=UPI001456DD71|nr:hypothetical protein [Lutibacter sp. B1]NLP58122.1 hypothetical protein [Lutibacter sp. B1]